jgi:hypothetical protein
MVVVVVMAVRVPMVTVRMAYMVIAGIQLDLILIDPTCPLICIHT